MKLLTVFIASLAFFNIWGQDLVTGEYLKEEFKGSEGILKYRIMYPNGFDESKPYPLVLFLHGSGERGEDNESQLIHGSKLFMDSIDTYPAVVIFPQCPKDDYWANLTRPDEGGRNRIFTFYTEKGPNPSLSLVIKLLEEMLQKPFIDKERIYFSGLSMGGFGIWELLWRIPEVPAVALPICGGAPREKGVHMTHIPIWAFHGVDDNAVHPRYSIAIVKSVQQAGGKAKLSLYPNVGHNSWDNAFAETDYLKWMFSKSK